MAQAQVARRRALLLRMEIELNERGSSGELDGLGAGHQQRVQFGSDLPIVERFAGHVRVEQLAQQSGSAPCTTSALGDQLVQIAEYLTHRRPIGRGGAALTGLTGDRGVQEPPDFIDVILRDSGPPTSETCAHGAGVGIEGVELSFDHKGFENATRQGSQGGDFLNPASRVYAWASTLRRTRCSGGSSSGKVRFAAGSPSST